jgi:hypothetical protein
MVGLGPGRVRRQHRSLDVFRGHRTTAPTERSLAPLRTRYGCGTSIQDFRGSWRLPWRTAPRGGTREIPFQCSGLVLRETRTDHHRAATHRASPRQKYAGSRFSSAEQAADGPLRRIWFSTVLPAAASALDRRSPRDRRWESSAAGGLAPVATFHRCCGSGAKVRLGAGSLRTTAATSGCGRKRATNCSTSRLLLWWGCPHDVA